MFHHNWYRLGASWLLFDLLIGSGGYCRDVLVWSSQVSRNPSCQKRVIFLFPGMSREIIFPAEDRL